jgi:signal transduction histidine kinase
MGTKKQTSISEWLVVLRADGVVDSVEGGAPPEWVGRPLAEAKGTPGVVRRAAATLMGAPPTSNVRRKKVRCLDGTTEIDVEVLLVEALPLRRAPTPVHQLVMRTLDLFASQAKSSRIELKIDQDRQVPAMVVIDAEKIAWALSTLVVNALRYTRTHVRVHVGWDDARDELVIEVADDGPGIPEGKIPWLFERDPVSGQAAGLALPMVRDVMAAHRGSVAVQNHAVGTAFTLRVPRVKLR